MNRLATLLIVALAMSISGCTGGGETVFTGLVNDNIRYNADTLTEDIADTLAQLKSTPQISDEELRSLYEAIRTRAMDGDLEATLIVLTIATLQRQPEEEE